MKKIKSLRYQEINGTYYFEGAFNSQFVFSDFFVSVPNPLRINFSKVHKVDSMGILHWAKGLKKYSELKIFIEECPYMLIREFNIFLEMIGEKQIIIKSFFVPYFCKKDEEEVMVLLNEGKNYKYGEDWKSIAEVKCIKCGTPMILDCCMEELFCFLGYDNQPSK